MLLLYSVSNAEADCKESCVPCIVHSSLTLICLILAYTGVYSYFILYLWLNRSYVYIPAKTE